MTDHGNIRDILQPAVGQRVIDISQHDKADLEDGKDAFVQFLFENGVTIKFYISENEAYASGVPICMQDPNTPDDPNDDGCWHPTEQEQIEGRWAVLEVANDDLRTGHVVPTFGKAHKLEGDCWCEPKFEKLTSEHRTRQMYTHNAEEGDGADIHPV